MRQLIHFINRVVENNNLEIVATEEVVEEEETVEVEEETTTSTTTTTLPENYISYLEEIRGERIVAINLGQEVLKQMIIGTKKLSPIKKQKKNLMFL